VRSICEAGPNHHDPGRTPVTIRVLDQHGTRVEQVEALALRVLLGLGSWLGDDHGHVAAGRGRVGQPDGQQRGLHAPAPVRGHGRRAGELRDALGYPHGGPADDAPVAQCGVAHVAGRG
jgi:hypothetical protein